MENTSRLFRLRTKLGMGPYISEEASIKLKQYKYAGGDNGFFYKIFYNPLALKLVSYLPETIA